MVGWWQGSKYGSSDPTVAGHSPTDGDAPTEAEIEAVSARERLERVLKLSARSRGRVWTARYHWPYRQAWWGRWKELTGNEVPEALRGKDARRRGESEGEA